MSSCARPLPFETLVAYWAGDLEPARSDEVEEHVFSCALCTKVSARIAAIAERYRALIPPVVTRAMVDELRARGLHVEDNAVTPEVRSHVVFAQQDVFIHHLGGLSLEDAERVDVLAQVEETGELIFEQLTVPFERARGEVLVSCQRHFAAFPPNILFVVTTTDRGGAERRKRFFVGHDYSAVRSGGDHLA